MLASVRTKLLHEAQRFRCRQKLASMLDSLRRDYWDLLKTQRQLKDELGKEEQDYEDIKTLGVATLVLRILGNLEQRVEKERQGVAAALLKFDQCSNEVETICKRIDELENEYQSLEDAPKEYKALSEEKKRLLLRESNPVIGELIGMEEELGRFENKIRNLDEAKHAGSAVLGALYPIQKTLKSARNWGIFDLAGGGLFVSIGKGERIEEANEAVKAVQEKLNRFKTELADTEISAAISIDVGILWRSADVFSNSVIVDCAVQDDIDNSRRNLQKSISQMKDLLDQIDAAKTAEEQSMRELTEKYRRLVEGA